MDFPTFERVVVDRWERVPARFREGVTALVVERGTWTQDFADGWVYGTTEPDPVFQAIPGAPVHSIIRLYHGSFVRIAADEAEFDWEEEIWETIRHELQHHLEWRAGMEDRDVEDDVERELERLWRGLPVTPNFHRWGVPIDRGVWLAADTLFLERRFDRAAWLGLTAGTEMRWGAVAVQVDPVAAQELDASDLLYLVAGWSEAEIEDESMPWRDVVVVASRIRGWFGR